MDPRFEITEQRRESGMAIPDGLPLVSIAWRVLRAQAPRRLEEQSRADAALRRLRESLVEVADQVHELKRMTRHLATRREAALPERLCEALSTVVKQLEGTLQRADFAVVDPEGEPYEGILTQLLENVAQQPDPAVTEPRIAEVLVPAILHTGAVLRMGKAVIAVPPLPPDTNRL